MTLFLSKQFSKTHRKTLLSCVLETFKTIAVFLENALNLILQIFLQPF